MKGPAGTITRTLHYNKTFVLRPSNITEAAWRSLFPSMPSTTLACYWPCAKQCQRRSRFLPSSSFWSKYLWVSCFPRAPLLSKFQTPRPRADPPESRQLTKLTSATQSAIRLGYYAALGETNVHEFEDSTDPDAALDVLNTHVDPSHVRHCFDYLRQTIMCNADTNLEIIDWQIGGSTGWGFERQCRDYDKIVDWAERWRYRKGQKINDLVDDPA